MEYNEQWAEELRLLAAIIEQAPLEKTTKWGSDVFTYNGKNVVSYGGFKHHFALWFYNGVFLKDKYGVLVTAPGGKTKSLRQWRFTAKSEIRKEQIGEYIAEAIEIEKKGLKIKPEKFRPLPPPPLLSTALRNDKTLETAFYRLTPGKQKEYIVYLNEAKQAATKERRLKKIIPMIKTGIGLNDQYK